MAPLTRKTRGRARLVALSFALVVATLLAWLLLRHGVEPRTDVADPGATASRASADARTAVSAPAAALHAGDPETSPPAAASRGSALSGIDVQGNPGPATTTSAAPDGSPGSVARSPAGGNPRDAQDDELEFPRYWRRCFRDTSTAADYLIAADSSTAWSGSQSVRVSSRVASPRSPGAGVCQVIAASNLKGRRIRLTLHMRTLDAVPGAHMLFRAEGGDGRVLAFYNMEPRWVSGTRDWAAYSAVLDVPEQASAVVFGGTLANAGTLWVDDALIEFVGREEAVTQGPPPGVHYNPVIDASSLSKALQNPGFEQSGPSIAPTD